MRTCPQLLSLLAFTSLACLTCLPSPQSLSGEPCESLGECLLISMTSYAAPTPWRWTEAEVTDTPSPVRLAINLSTYLTVGVLSFGSIVATLIEAFARARRRERDLLLEQADGCTITTHYSLPSSYNSLLTTHGRCSP